MSKKERLEEIDKEIGILQAKLDEINRLERNILELKILKAKLPLYFIPSPILINFPIFHV